MLPFTLRNIANELEGRVDFEIMAINNYCEEVKKQGRDEDKAGGQVKGQQRGFPWLHYLEYKNKLSHWQSKNLGVANSTGKYLWFCDSHCHIKRDSLYDMFTYFKAHEKQLNGTIHLPLSYHILEYHRLIYKLKAEWERGYVHYSFSAYRDEDEPYQVPCMSTCGMLMSRALYDELGGWPKELGCYGGGENFINYTMATLGKKIWIMPGGQLCHHGDKRGYHWTGDDYSRNMAIATYIFGGVDLARTFIDNRKGSKRALYKIFNNVLDSCHEHRKMIRSKQVIEIREWAKQWEG